MVDSAGTKQRIIRTMVALLANTSLDRLQVNAICEQAGISRQTFYRCFDDKYAAAVWYVDGLVSATCRRIGRDLGWHDGYLRFFRLVERNHIVMHRLGESRDRSSIFYSTIRSSASDYRESYVARHGNEPGELLSFQMHAFAQMATTCVTEWIDGGCQPRADIFIDWFLSLIPRDLFATLDMPAATDEDADRPLFLGA